MSGSGLERDGYLDLRLVAIRLWRRRWLISACALAFAAFFLAGALFMDPVYRAKVIVVPAGSDSIGRGGAGAVLAQLGGLASIAGLSLGNEASSAEEALAVLRSRELTERFLRENNLLGELFHERWDRTRATWRAAEDPPTWGEAYRRFDETVRSTSYNRKTGLITVQIEWRDPALAAAWANRLVELVNAEMRERAISRSSASVKYLEQELADTSAVDTRVVISRLLESQINQRMLANVSREYSFRVVDRAVPPDREDILRPRKGLMTALGALIGVFFGVVAALLWPIPPRDFG